MSGKSRREMAEGNRRLYTALAASVTRGEYRPLEGAMHSTMTIDRPDAVVQAARGLLPMVSGCQAYVTRETRWNGSGASPAASPGTMGTTVTTRLCSRCAI